MRTAVFFMVMCFGWSVWTGCTATQKTAKGDADFVALVQESDKNKDKKLDFLADEKLPNEEFKVSEKTGETALEAEFLEKKPVKAAKFRIQVFAGSPLNAQKNFVRLDSVRPGEVYMIKDAETDLWKVWVGNYMTRDEADKAKQEMISGGFPDAWIHEMKPPYDAPVTGPLFWVQVASLSGDAAASRMKEQLASAQREPVEIRQKDGTWKVWVGGYPDRAAAEDLKKMLEGLGYTKTFIVQSDR